VWLDSGAGGTPGLEKQKVMRGEVRDSVDGYSSGEWMLLVLESLLPLDDLAAGKIVEFTQEANSNAPIAGPTMGMRRGIWVPVLAAGELRGVLLLATQEAAATLPFETAEEVAAELGFALEWEEHARLAQEHKADLEIASRIHMGIAADVPAVQLLREIAESCASCESPLGLGTIFALIGERHVGLAVGAPSAARGEERLEVSALSGEPAWAHSVKQGPLEMFWRSAVETRQIVGAEPTSLPLARDIGRIVAFPLACDGVVRGVLLAGLPPQRANSETMERLEGRALLAARVLQHQARLAEQAELEHWRQSLLESSDQPVVLLDAGGFLRGASRGAKALLNPPAPTIAAHSGKVDLRFSEMFRSREWERVHHWLLEPSSTPGKRESGGEILQAELKNGTLVECRRLDLAAGEFLAVGLHPVARFPRERTREEVEIELRQTVEWMEEGVVLFDEAGRVRAVNERFHRMLGLTGEEAAGAGTFEDLVRLAARHARDPEAFERNWRELAESPGGETQEELQMDWPVLQTIERCTREITGDNGRRLGRVEVYREMTARRMFQSRMAETEKLASLGQRVSGIVHDLSNPLTTILGYAQRLLPRFAAAGPEVQNELRGILGEAERATGILRQLLRLSGETRSVREKLSVNDLVDRTAELMRAALSGGPIRLVIEKEPGLSAVEGEFGQLQQVLLNLFQNAQQAIEQSGKGSLIGVRTVSAGEGRVRLEVWDDGPGIPGAIQARIFDPFFTTKPPGVGTGLGLAIVLGFVRQHGGTVNVVSAPRGGTRFLVELPALRASDAPPLPEPELLRFPPGQGWEGSRQRGGPRAAKVLVVEDEPTVGGLIADVLRDEGMRVDVLRDGHAALARAERETYDLVICDLKMPGMDGKKFFHSLGQRHNPLQDHVLFVTGDVVAPSTQEFLERHRLPYVAKPFRVEELSRAVRELL
jgi:PAS domain S-box-containing protein